MNHEIYLWVKVHNTETDEEHEKMLSMDTADRNEAVSNAKEWMFRHVTWDRDLQIKQACLYRFSENILHLHQEKLKERIEDLDAETKAIRIQGLENELERVKRDLAKLKGEG